MVRGRIGKSIKWGRVGGENKSWLMKRKARHMMNINPLKGPSLVIFTTRFSYLQLQLIICIRLD